MNDPHDTNEPSLEGKHQHEQLLEDATRTPLWLPLVGAALFFAAAVYWIATRPERPVELEEPAAGAVAAEGPESDE